MCTNLVKFYGIKSDGWREIETVLDNTKVFYDEEAQYNRDGTIDLHVQFYSTEDKLKGLDAFRHRY